jgi:hypothetical protein
LPKPLILKNKGGMIMKFKPTVIIATVVVTMGLLLGTSAAQAANVIFDPNDSTKATGIEDLDIGGTLYNVTFTETSTAAVQVYGPFPGTFDFDTSQTAADAANAVNNALNINGAQTVGAEESGGLPFYRIGFKSQLVGPIEAVIFWEAIKGDGDLDPWVKNVDPDVDLYALGVRIWADFTPTTEPDPPCAGDLNNDGAVDVDDFNILIEDWGRTDCPIQ